MTTNSPLVQDQTRSKPAPTPWWKGAVIYQVYPRSFADSNGDGIGDLAGITARLDHIASLGVDAIWLSPFYPSPMDDFGYDISDYCDVDPIFGSLADFDALVARAHALGLKVTTDLVFAHTSDEHPWFAESRRSRANPRADWYVWADPLPDGSPPNNWLSVFGGPAWEWDPRRRQYYLHNFLPSQPDLNFHQPQVQEAVMALYIEYHFTKDEILEAYLNRVYFGAGAYGIDAASRAYFAKRAPELDIWESAVLAGLLKAPSRFSPARA